MTDPAPATAPPLRHVWRQRVLAVSLLALAAGASWGVAQQAVGWIESRAMADATQALIAGGFDWATASADGLSLRLSGEAPDEVQRFRAVSTVGGVVDAGRITDAITVAPPAAAVAPSFRLELLRTDAGVSLVGLAPKGLDRAALTARLGGGVPVSDLIEIADYPAPPHWDQAVAFALTAAEMTPRGKISVAAGRVQIAALADGAADKARLEAALAEARPEGVELVTEISAPRPVIAPFALTLDKTGGGLRLTSCAADTEAAQARIVQALAAAGLSGAPDCPLALGAPSPQWGEAAAAAIAALASLHAGQVVIRDAEVTLTAPALVPPTVFAQTRDQLAAALPGAFRLTATLEQAATLPPSGPVVFSAEATADGVRLAGAISDDRMRGAVESLAAARFGRVEGDLGVNAAAPSGWSLRVIGALDAMAALQGGTAEVMPDLIRLTGATGSRTAAAGLATALARRTGAGADYEFALRYDPRLDPAVDTPSGTDCVDQLNDAMQQSEIGFEPSRAVIAGDASDTLEKLAAIMKSCDGFRLEIGGHTDSQGSDELNMTLSHDRAEAVAVALREAGIATANLTVAGYGASRPVADNDTDDGREANRRIEFRLLSPDPVNSPVEPVRIVRGTTTAAPPEPAHASESADAGHQHDAAAAPRGGALLAGPLAAVPPELESEPSAPPADDAAVAALPAAPVVDGNRITTPVPPLLPTGERSLTVADEAQPDAGAGRRPPPRPEN